jgi:hypothetical protein
VTEAQLLELITSRCDQLGLLWFHVFDSRKSRLPGFPDLVIAGHGLLFRELKSAGGPVSARQSAWGRVITGAGGNWAVWRPCDWESGLIQSELRTLAECPCEACGPREFSLARAGA